MGLIDHLPIFIEIGRPHLRLVDHWLAHQTCISSLLTVDNDSSCDSSLIIIILINLLRLIHAHVVVVKCLELVVLLESLRVFRFFRP